MKKFILENIFLTLSTNIGFFILQKIIFFGPYLESFSAIGYPFTFYLFKLNVVYGGIDGSIKQVTTFINFWTFVLNFALLALPLIIWNKVKNKYAKYILCILMFIFYTSIWLFYVGIMSSPGL